MSERKNNNGITDLMIAASRGDLARVEALLREGSDANARDAFGQFSRHDFGVGQTIEQGGLPGVRIANQRNNWVGHRATT